MLLLVTWRDSEAMVLLTDITLFLLSLHAITIETVAAIDCYSTLEPSNNRCTDNACAVWICSGYRGTENRVGYKIVATCVPGAHEFCLKYQASIELHNCYRLGYTNLSYCAVCYGDYCNQPSRWFATVPPTVVNLAQEPTKTMNSSQVHHTGERTTKLMASQEKQRTTTIFTSEETKNITTSVPNSSIIGNTVLLISTNTPSSGLPVAVTTLKGRRDSSPALPMAQMIAISASSSLLITFLLFMCCFLIFLRCYLCRHNDDHAKKNKKETGAKGALNGDTVRRYEYQPFFV